MSIRNLQCDGIIKLQVQISFSHHWRALAQRETLASRFVGTRRFYPDHALASEAATGYSGVRS
jgi:hypothetical protein